MWRSIAAAALAGPLGSLAASILLVVADGGDGTPPGLIVLSMIFTVQGSLLLSMLAHALRHRKVKKQLVAPAITAFGTVFGALLLLLFSGNAPAAALGGFYGCVTALTLLLLERALQVSNR